MSFLRKAAKHPNMFFKNLSSQSLKDGVVILILLLVWAFGVLTDGNAINNGDWLRSTITAGFVPPSWQELAPVYPFTEQKRIDHPSSMAAVIWTLGLIAQVFGAKQFSADLLSGFLGLTFFSGLFFIWKRHVMPGRNILLASLICLYLLFRFYFKSFYEEAIVLAVLPWLCFGYYEMLAGRSCRIFVIISVIILFSKIQMIWLAPAFFVLYLCATQVKFWSAKSLIFMITSISVVVVMLFGVGRGSGVEFPNKYNRYYNGLGWTILQSSNWPGSEFNARAYYFNQNKDDLQQQVKHMTAASLLGTSYWPTGSELRMSADNATGFTKDKQLGDFDEMISRGSFESYLRYFYDNPAFILLFLKNIYITTLQSDYSLDYLRASLQRKSNFSNRVSKARDTVLSNFGLITLIFLLVFLIAKPRSCMTLLIAWLFLSPLVVVIGDGYYEYEKHLIPFMFLLPLVVASYANKRLCVHTSAEPFEG